MLSSTDLGILADDLTGACDAAAAFAPFVGPVEVVIEPLAAATAPGSAVAVLNTQSRLLSPLRSRRRVERIARRLAGRPVIYKKTDSVLRGPAGAELEGMALLFPRHAVVVIPSVPAMGKTMRNGRLFERGIPAHETDYGRDPMSPLATNDARQILQSTGRFTFELEDAETDEDVERGVSRALDRGNVILAGSVALADCLARRVERKSWTAPCSAAPRRILLLSGSQYALARHQMLDAASAFGQTIADVGDRRAEAARADGRGILLVQIDTTRIRAGHTRRKLPSLFRKARRIVRSYAPEAIGIVGGETAYRILRLLGTTRLLVTGREQLGMPYGRILDGELSGCPFITKGGSVGTADACRRMVGRLQE